jgi:hypothetical protein
MHARDCECATCEAGLRPNERQRKNAELAWEAAARRKKEEEEKRKREAEEAKPGTREERRRAMAAKSAAMEAATEKALQGLTQPLRPATAEELRQMRREWFPNLKRRGDDES